MSNRPADEERLDADPEERLDTDLTDELPILLETAVLDPEEHRLAFVVGDDPTGEHTVHRSALSVPEGANLDELKDEVAQRNAKIAFLEQDIARLSARWVDIEHHLNAKDTVIEELNATLGSLRAKLDAHAAAEQRMTADIGERAAQLGRVAGRLEQVKREAAARELELAEQKHERQKALDELATAKARLAQNTAAGEPVDLQPLREELATLAAYIASRRGWWDELEAQTSAQAARIAELEREVAHRADRQQRAESLAQHELARAEALREDLVGQSRRVETLHARLSQTELEPLAVRATVDALNAELGTAKAAAAEAQTRLAEATRALADQQAAFTLTEQEHAAAIAAADERRVAELAAAVAAATESARAAAALSAAIPHPSLATIAQLEADMERKSAELATERTTVREQAQRLEIVTVDLEAARRELTDTRAEMDQARQDVARIEGTLLDKDVALAERDERIAALQRDLDQRVGALQKLTAMDLSLQGLDSKMSERLRRKEPPVDRPNTPALVCLTSDAPRQYALIKKTMTIGRSARCDIQILTHFVSREHARLTLNRGVVVIEDLGSTNGVFVNATRVDRQELHQGDLITVGETQFRFLESMAH